MTLSFTSTEAFGCSGYETSANMEMGFVGSTVLANTTVDTFSWSSINVTVKDRTTKTPLSLLSNAAGMVRGGEILAIMGPSGSGKTTLLNALAHRVAAAGATTTSNILANGQSVTRSNIRSLSSYVEQEDTLIGSLTVRETMMFAAQLTIKATYTLSVKSVILFKVAIIKAYYIKYYQQHWFTSGPWLFGVLGACLVDAYPF